METELREALSCILKITKDKPVLIEVRSNKLYVGTYSESHKIVYETPIMHDNFRVTISADLIKELPNFISSDFSLHENFILFKKIDGSTTKISLTEDDISLSMLAKGYEKHTKAEFIGKDLKDAFFYVKHASNDKTIGDIVLKGAHFTIKPGSSEVMASNGAMLSLSKLHQSNTDFDTSQILLLNPEIFNVIRVFGDGIIKIGFNETSVSLSYSENLYTVRIVSSLLNGKDPLPYGDIVNTTKLKNTISFVVNKPSFLEAVKQVKIFTDHRLKISIYKTGEFEISSSGAKGEARRRVEVFSVKNEQDINLEIDVNVEYLFSYLSSNKSETLKVSFSEETSPILFEDNIGIEILASLRKE